MKRAEKQEEVERLQKELATVRHAVLVDYKGITVPQVTELRNKIRSAGGRYEVVKNRLVARAVAEAPLARVREHLRGPTAIAWSVGEPVALAKTLTQFAKTAPVVQFKAVLLDGMAIPVAELEQVANLPSVHELRGKLVGLLASPMRRLVTALSGPPRNLLSVVHQKAGAKG